MHIIGGHDYYDCMLAYGRDMDIVFVRDGRKVPATLHREQAADGYESLRTANDVVHMRYNDKTVRQTMWPRHDWIELRDKLIIKYNVITVFVADTMYRGIRLHVVHDSSPYSAKSEVHYVWSNDQLDKIIPHLQVMSVADRWALNDKPRIEYFGSKKLNEVQLDTMITNKIAVAIADGAVDDIVINGDQLKSIGFYRVLDPLQCYTILYDWISGVLASNANRMVMITDPKILLKKHGMDATSFRTPKKKAT